MDAIQNRLITYFPQTSIERELYMRIPKGFKIDAKDKHGYMH